MGKYQRIAARVAAQAATDGFRPCYLEYFRLFNEQEYFEAHDVLEHIWLGSSGQRHVLYKALIQLAGGYVHLQHHHREPSHRIHGKRLRPAARLFRRSAELLGTLPARCEGIDLDGVISMAVASAELIESANFAENPWRPDRAPQLCLPV